MKNLIRAACRAWLLLMLAPLAAAQSLPKTALDGLEVRYVRAVAVDSRPGRSQQLQVEALPGDRLTLHLPFAPNRFEPLVADGSTVASGDAVARISGPELALWFLEARTVAARFADAERRYERNRALYEQQALDASTWLAISEQYRALRVENHHVQHALEWMEPSSADGGLSTGDREGPSHGPEAALLRVPRGGIVLFDAASVDAGAPKLSIVDSASLRLSGWIPADRQTALAGVSSAGCTLEIAQVEARVSGFSRRVWSAPIRGCLPSTPGLRLSGRLLYAFAGYRVPRSAVFRSEGQTVVAVDRGAELQVVAVEIAGEDAGDYYVRSADGLGGADVLAESTSALQGLLMGLGGEG